MTRCTDQDIGIEHAKLLKLGILTIYSLSMDYYDYYYYYYYGLLLSSRDYYEMFTVYGRWGTSEKFGKIRTCVFWDMRAERQTNQARTYVSETDIYPHMPTYVHTPLDFTNDASLAWHLRRRISTVVITCGWAWPARLSFRPVLGFWGSKVHKNGRFPALDDDKSPCKIWCC